MAALFPEQDAVAISETVDAPTEGKKLPAPFSQAAYAAWLASNQHGSGRWNVRFFLYVFAGCALQTLGVFWPLVRDHIFGARRSNCEALVGLATHRQFFQTDYFWLSVGAVGVALVGWIFCFRIRPLRAARNGVLVGAALYLTGLAWVYNGIADGQRALAGLATGNVYEAQWENLTSLKIIECESMHLHSKEKRNELRHGNLKTFAEFHKLVMSEYARRSPDLPRCFPRGHVNSEEKLKCVFIMNYVADLWSFGNRLEPDKPGDALRNEQNNFEAAAPSVRAYLEAKIGCCADWAYMCKFLLDCEGFENRLTTVGGHVFNEVRLDGRWNILDATVNIFVETSWEELYARQREANSIVVLLFPSTTAHDDRSPRYRPLTGQYRLMSLLRLANRPERLRRTTHPDLPEYFK